MIVKFKHENDNLVRTIKHIFKTNENRVNIIGDIKEQISILTRQHTETIAFNYFESFIPSINVAKKEFENYFCIEVCCFPDDKINKANLRSEAFINILDEEYDTIIDDLALLYPEFELPTRDNITVGYKGDPKENGYIIVIKMGTYDENIATSIMKLIGNSESLTNKLTGLTMIISRRATARINYYTANIVSENNDIFDGYDDELNNQLTHGNDNIFGIQICCVFDGFLIRDNIDEYKSTVKSSLDYIKSDIIWDDKDITASVVPKKDDGHAILMYITDINNPGELKEAIDTGTHLDITLKELTKSLTGDIFNDIQVTYFTKDIIIIDNTDANLFTIQICCVEDISDLEYQQNMLKEFVVTASDDIDIYPSISEKDISISFLPAKDKIGFTINFDINVDNTDKLDTIQDAFDNTDIKDNLLDKIQFFIGYDNININYWIQSKLFTDEEHDDSIPVDYSGFSDGGKFVVALCCFNESARYSVEDNEFIIKNAFLSGFDYAGDMLQIKLSSDDIDISFKYDDFTFRYTVVMEISMSDDVDLDEVKRLFTDDDLMIQEVLYAITTLKIIGSIDVDYYTENEYKSNDFQDDYREKMYSSEPDTFTVNICCLTKDINIHEYSQSFIDIILDGFSSYDSDIDLGLMSDIKVLKGEQIDEEIGSIQIEVGNIDAELLPSILNYFENNERITNSFNDLFNTIDPLASFSIYYLQTKPIATDTFENINGITVNEESVDIVPSFGKTDNSKDDMSIILCCFNYTEIDSIQKIDDKLVKVVANRFDKARETILLNFDVKVPTSDDIMVIYDIDNPGKQKITIQINLNDDEFTEYVQGMFEDDYAFDDDIHDVIFNVIARNDVTVSLFDEIEADSVADPELLDKLDSLSSDNVQLIQQKELNIPDQMVSIPLLDDYQHDPFVFSMCCSGKLSVFDNYHDRIKDAIYDGFNDIKPKLMKTFPDEDIPETSQMNLDVYPQCYVIYVYLSLYYFYIL